MKILVVDDMTSMRHVMIGMLRRLGFTDIDEATDGKRALELLGIKSYQLVISDLNMPHVDGLALLHEIRSRPALKDLKLLMVTCENGRDRVQQVLLQKVDGFVIKPFSLATLEKQFKKMKLLDTIE
ncbi:two-component system response regulator [Pseudoalteromonas rubra]|uniref:Two-component system response regulator n=1 Tax=Pseudoalteromonas rubra TaxID=43658 RepID=A0A5S3WLZ7_9GAMM|nr:response regulator [Pseudoalteromonas rubra]TMP27587.1 two-component system response regulator [Pseudoalteromonas rubra]TMP28930.1 two-component system response regulator [Pseudoalteromonas rubra]